MGGSAFVDGFGWAYFFFDKKIWADRFIKEHPQRKGAAVIIKTKIDLRMNNKQFNQKSGVFTEQ